MSTTSDLHLIINRAHHLPTGDYLAGSDQILPRRTGSNLELRKGSKPFFELGKAIKMLTEIFQLENRDSRMSSK